MIINDRHRCVAVTVVVHLQLRMFYVVMEKNRSVFVLTEFNVLKSRRKNVEVAHFKTFLIVVIKAFFSTCSTTEHTFGT